MAEPRWREPFLDAIADGFSVKGAADKANVGRRTVYDHLERDEKFKAAHTTAIDAGTQRLEDEARRRAVEGVDQPVYHQGEEVGVVRRYSDTLLIFLLKARDPKKYRDHVKHEHAGADGGPVDVRVHFLPPDA